MSEDPFSGFHPAVDPVFCFEPALYTSPALDLSGLYHGGNFICQYGWLYGIMFL